LKSKKFIYLIIAAVLAVTYLAACTKSADNENKKGVKATIKGKVVAPLKKRLYTSTRRAPILEALRSRRSLPRS